MTCYITRCTLRTDYLCVLHDFMSLEESDHIGFPLLFIWALCYQAD